MSIASILLRVVMCLSLVLGNASAQRVHADPVDAANGVASTADSAHEDTGMPCHGASMRAANADADVAMPDAPTRDSDPFANEAGQGCCDTSACACACVAPVAFLHASIATPSSHPAADGAPTPRTAHYRPPPLAHRLRPPIA